MIVASDFQLPMLQMILSHFKLSGFCSLIHNLRIWQTADQVSAEEQDRGKTEHSGCRRTSSVCPPRTGIVLVLIFVVATHHQFVIIDANFTTRQHLHLL